MAASAERGLDTVEHRLCVLDPTMGHQPARRFRQPQAHEEDHEPEYGPDQEGQAPAQIRRQQVGIEQHERTCRAQRGADPKAAVDDEIAPATIACRHQLPWILELIAVYSPPMPAPVKKRNRAKLARFHDSAVAAVATR